MKRKLMLSCSVAVLCLLQIAMATSRPDFSGTWVLDTNRSFSNPAGLEQTLVIVQTGDQIKLDTKIKTQQGEQSLNEVYSLDNQETDFTPNGAPPGAKGKRKAKWLPEGRGVFIEEVTTSDSPKGPVIRQVARKWTLSPDGNTLTIDYYFDDQRGSFEAKRVFVRK